VNTQKSSRDYQDVVDFFFPDNQQEFNFDPNTSFDNHQKVWNIFLLLLVPLWKTGEFIRDGNNDHTRRLGTRGGHSKRGGAAAAAN
jgi:hypothetical protein